jgi:PKD repeat protein
MAHIAMANDSRRPMAYEFLVPLSLSSRCRSLSGTWFGRRFGLGHALLPLAAFAFSLVACSEGDGLLLPSEGEPAAILVLRGDGQQGRVGEPLSDPLVFAVTDSRDRPVEGAIVTIELTSAAPGAQVIPQTATTDANGLANVQLVLGTRIGAQNGTASVTMGGGKQIPQVSFRATALPENANQIAPVAGEDQTGRVSTALPDRLVVKVTDAFDNPIEGVPIDWTVEGGGSVSAATVITDEQGLASVERILGPGTGQQTTFASSEGLAGSPVTFVHTALAGDAALLTIVSGNNQTGQVGSELAAELVVRLVDGQGNGVPDTPLTWSVVLGGGSIVTADNITDADGQASARWILGPLQGPNRLDATVSGVGVASFHAAATPGAPSALVIRTQPPATARNGVEFERAPVVQLQDQQGNAVSQPGVQIAVALGAGGGTLTGTRQRLTDADGQASFTDLAIVGGAGPYTLVFSSTGYASTTSAAIDLRAVSTLTTITGDSPDPSAPGATVTVQFRVSSEGPTPGGTVSVTDGVESCNGTLAAGTGSCDLALSTPGDRTLRATYSGAPGLNGGSATESHRVQAPPPENRSPTADFTWTCQGLSCQFTDRSSDPDGAIAGRTWSFGDGSPNSTEKDPAHTFSSAGSYTVTLTVTDNGGAAGATSNTVAVTAPPPPQNKAPRADFEADCNHLDCSFTDKSRDDDGTIVAYQWNFGDGQASTDPNPVHPYVQEGKYQVTLTVTDNGGASDTKVRDVDAKAPPPAPTELTIVSDDPDPSDFGAAITVQFTVTSPEGTPTGTVLVSDPNGGSCTGEAPAGNCTLTPGGDGKRDLTATYQGNASFKSSSAKTDHTVNPPPPAGTVTSITADTPDPSQVGQQVVVNFGVTSAAGTPTGSVKVTVSEGTESCTGPLGSGAGSCTLTLASSGPRTLMATYQGDARYAASSSQAVSHSVIQPNQAPSAANDQYEVAEEGSLTVPAAGVLSNDSDPDQNPLTAILQSGPGHGSLTLRGDGSFDYAPEFGFVGNDAFTYVASDGVLSSSPATVTITVSQVQPPVAVSSITVR